MANRNFSNGGKIFMMESKPVMVTMNFIVDSSDSAGLGIRSLKGATVQNVFMHTSATPGAGNSNPSTPNVTVTNPNPAAGTIVIQLQDNYNKILDFNTSMISPNSGSSLLVASAGLTAGIAYVITILGNTTTAAWHTLGVPAGITPAVGVAFIAAHTSAVGTGAVQISAATGSGVATIEGLGLPNLLTAPAPSANQGFGAEVILQARDYAGAIAAPADGTIIAITLMMSDSTVTVMGQ